MLSFAFVVSACDSKLQPRVLEPDEAPVLAEDAGAIDGTDEPIFADEAPAAPEVDPDLGGPCLEDSQCNDSVDCTFDVCDLELGLCRFTPDAARCQDDVYCNGSESCVPRVGCRPGEPVTCDDQSPCTLDRCVEATQQCERVPRDLDGDGDPDRHCVTTGGDCDDENPNIASLRPEVCNNGWDDNCDDQVDEAECELPRGDNCESPILIEGPQTIVLQMNASLAHAAASCAPNGSADSVIQLSLAEPADVVVRARGQAPEFALAVFDQCNDGSTERACVAATPLANPSVPTRPSGLLVARARAVPAGDVWLWVWDSTASELELEVDLEPVTSQPANETCDSALPVEAGSVTRVDLAGVQRDLDSVCNDWATDQVGELVYSLELDEPSDVEVFAIGAETAMSPRLALYRAGCSRRDEIVCTVFEGTSLFARALEAGRYFIAASASLPGGAELLVSVTPATEEPEGDTCTAPALLGDEALQLQLAQYADDISLPCAEAGRDVVAELSLAERSDLLLEVSAAAGDRVALALLPQSCDVAELASCLRSETNGLSRAFHDVLPGNYRVVAESALGSAIELFSATRPARPPLAVVVADTCEEALEVPLEGGSFWGDTSRAAADWTASCDYPGYSAGGAGDQILKLELTETRRVILQAEGTGYAPLLNLRQGQTCPGREVMRGCSPDLYGRGAKLDLVLEPDRYWLQVDGVAGEQGRWNLEVFVLPP